MLRAARVSTLLAFSCLFSASASAISYPCFETGSADRLCVTTRFFAQIKATVREKAKNYGALVCWNNALRDAGPTQYADPVWAKQHCYICDYVNKTIDEFIAIETQNYSKLAAEFNVSVEDAKKQAMASFEIAASNPSMSDAGKEYMRGQLRILEDCLRRAPSKEETGVCLNSFKDAVISAFSL